MKYYSVDSVGHELSRLACSTRVGMCDPPVNVSEQ